MLQPQSDDEIRPIEAKLREMDPLLSIRWNPRSKVIPSRSFDAYGLPHPPIIEGRWEVVREMPRGERPGVVYVVRHDGEGGDAYRPVGWWLVEYMQRWDSAQRHFLDEIRKEWAEHDAAEARAAQLDDNATRQFLDEQYHKVGGRHWIGRGFGAGRRILTLPGAR